MSKNRWSSAVLILLFGFALGMSRAWKVAPPAAFAGVQAAELPQELAGYAARADAQSSVSPEVRAALASADIATATYFPRKIPSEGDKPIEFVLIGGTDRTALHDPRSCLIGSGWRIENDHAEALPDTPGLTVRSCRIINNESANRGGYDLLYVYVVDGHAINSVTEIRTQMLVSALLGRKNAPVYFLRFIRPVSAAAARNDPNVVSVAASADHRELQRFAAAMWQDLRLIER